MNTFLIFVAPFIVVILATVATFFVAPKDKMVKK